MRVTFKTPDGQLGTGELDDGVELADLVGAMRNHRLFVVPAEDVQLDDPTPPAGTTLPASSPKPKARRARS